MAIGMALYGVQHGHAGGKAQAIQDSPDVELSGVFEPDPPARARAQGQPAFGGVRWYGSAEEMLHDPGTIAVAIEGLNVQGLGMAREAIVAGKHLWYDKPAGDDWPAFQELADMARRRGLIIQMGYMFRYQDGFARLAEWCRTGVLGDIFAIRAHMSTSLSAAARGVIATHPGGILYDLGGHMLDQVLWMLGDERPSRVTSFLRNDATPGIPPFADNTLAVLEFSRAMGMVDIAAMETRPMARRFEVYGSAGSAIMDPMEPATELRLCLDAPRAEFGAGRHTVPLTGMSRQRTYELELAAFVPTIQGQRPPDRSIDHELLVQETLLRATGRIAGH